MSSPTQMARTSPFTSEVAPVVAKQSLDVSVLVPVLDEVGTVEELSRQVCEVLGTLGKSFEIVFVDDGSTDGTIERLRALHRDDPRVKMVCFRRNFGKAAALSAGF